jgi:hypothetical protein
MAIKKVPRTPEELELLRLYATVEPVQALDASLRDAGRMEEFLQTARTSLERSLATPSRVKAYARRRYFGRHWWL